MRKVLIFVLTFVLFLPSISAYDFVNSDNKDKVFSDRREIYSLKSTYDELAGEDEEEVEIVYEPVNNSNYLWPIGSSETTTSGGKTFALGDPEETTITSQFGYRGAVINSSGTQIAGNENHGAIDIANMRGVGVTNIIAAKDGVVVYPTENAKINCKNSDSNCTGYGNYVIIQHSDGNYTLYGHLHENTITVKAGDTVKQGQVIAKMGTSGNSTGSHLHFEIRLGENSSSARVDPLNYVSIDNPRPKESTVGPTGDYSLEALFEYISEFEGTGCQGKLSEEGDNYVACTGEIDYWNITIGHGVTSNNHPELFAAKGYPNVQEGDRIPKSVVDDIEREIIKNHYDYVVSTLANNGIDSLKDYQIMALVSQDYNGTGVIVDAGEHVDFVSHWPLYKDTYKFEDIYEHKPSLWYDALAFPYKNGYGLRHRRVSEWILFTTGSIDYCEDNFDDSKYAWPE